MATFVVGTPVETQDPIVEVSIDGGDPLGVGKHVFSLTVVDDAGNASKPAEVVVIIRDDQAPTAVIKAPDQVGVGQSFTLDGSASSDLAPGKIISYTWTLVE